MDEELLTELLKETTIEDISDKYRPVVDIIGVKHFADLGQYSRGNDLYFPKLETIVIPARNRRIKREYNGYNVKELAERYNLTTKQIHSILKGVAVPGQIDMFDIIGAQED